MEVRNNTQNLNFKAKLIAKAITHVGNKEIKLYQLDGSDKKFVDKMISKVDLETLYPNQSDYNGFASWKAIIDTSAKRVGVDNVVLATHQKRPCGILVYKKEPHKIFQLTNLATWPIKEGFKVPHAGKVLMHSIFTKAKQDKVNLIYLRPNSQKLLGKSCLDFYEPLGFKLKNGVYMQYCSIENVNYSSKTAQLENFFEMKKCKNSENINLNKELSLEFKDTLKEKVLGLIENLKSRFLLS